MEDTLYKTELITQLSQLEEYRKQYEEFCTYLPTSEQFTYNLDWVIQHHALYTQKGISLFWIVLWDKNDIIAVAPLQKECLNASRLGLRRLRIWGDNNYYIHNNQPSILIKEKSTTEKAIAKIVDCLNTELKNSWDELFFHRVKSENATFKLFTQLYPTVKIEPSTDVTYYFSSPNHIEDIIRGESKRKIKKGLEKLKSDFSNVSINCYTEISVEKYSQMVDLHTKRQFSANQKGAERNSFFNNSIENKTIQNEIKFATQKKALRLYTLEVDGTLAAFLLCYHMNNWTYAHITAFDDRYKHYKAARILWFHAFTEERKTHGCDLIDTGWGGNQFKKAFSNKTEALYAIRMENKNAFRSKLINQGLNAPRAVRQFLKQQSKMIKKTG